MAGKSNYKRVNEEVEIGRSWRVEGGKRPAQCSTAKAQRRVRPAQYLFHLAQCLRANPSITKHSTQLR